MRWFFFWEASDSLWAYGSDTGYFRHCTFPSGATAIMSPVEKGAAIPREVWNGLPDSKQKVYVVASGKAP